MCYYRAMSRKRLTREDSRDQTTQRLLAAAQKLIAKKGLSATSLEDIAEAAGYTRGAFYSNFGSKSDMFIELLHRNQLDTRMQLSTLRDDSLSTEHIDETVREIYGQLYRDNESFLNWTEARMLAVRDPKFRRKLNVLLAEQRGEIAEFIEYFYRRLGVAPPVPAAAMAMGFMSLWEGVRLSMLSSPGEMPPDAAHSVLTLFVDSVLHLARMQAEKSTKR